MVVNLFMCAVVVGVVALALATLWPIATAVALAVATPAAMWLATHVLKAL
jgi:hypothetical protein